MDLGSPRTITDRLDAGEVFQFGANTFRHVILDQW